MLKQEVPWTVGKCWATSTYSFDQAAMQLFNIDVTDELIGLSSVPLLFHANVSTSAGTCSEDTGKQTTITLNSGDQATVSVFYKVQYSTDGGTTWETLKSDEEVPPHIRNL